MFSDWKSISGVNCYSRDTLALRLLGLCGKDTYRLPLCILANGFNTESCFHAAKLLASEEKTWQLFRTQNRWIRLHTSPSIFLLKLLKSWQLKSIHTVHLHTPRFCQHLIQRIYNNSRRLFVSPIKYVSNSNWFPSIKLSHTILDSVCHL